MRSIKELTDEDCRLQFETKVYGLMLLDELFKEKELDFFWVMSSISCVLAGLGFGAYASANIFMDAFVKKHNQLNGKRNYRFSLNWDGMREDISLSLFKRMFALGRVDQLVASVGGDLQGRIDRWIKLKSVRGAQDSDGVEKERAAPAHPRPTLSTDYVAPGNPTETAVANIWKSLLGFDEIGVHDDFLELGGDSLKSITVISKIHQKLNVNIPLTEFFNNPTIEGIAQYISASKRKDMYVSIEPVEKKEFYPASSAQKRLYILQQIEKEAVTYSMSYVLKLEDDFNKNRLENAFRKIIQRHESLKTSFELHEGKVIQRINQGVKFSIELFAGISKQAVTEIVNKFMRSFDLSIAPLFRVGLIELEEKSHILMVDMHHIISDGISLEITVRDFMKLYNGEELPALTLQYKDFSEWQNLGKENPTIKKQEKYWLKELEGNIPELVLPYDYSRPAVQSFEGDTFGFEIDENETKGLKELAANEETTLFMALLAIYGVLLWMLSGQEDIVVGTGIAGRRHEELQEIIGLFVNSLPLRFYPKEDRTFREFLKEVKEKTLLAYENQDYQFEDLVEKVVSDRNPSRNPLFDAVIVSQNVILTSGLGQEQESEKTEDPQLNLKSTDFAPKISKFDISLICTPAGNRFQFVIEYSTKLFKKETIERYEIYLKEIISHILENNDIKLEDIAVSHHLLSAAEDNPEMELEF